MGSTGSPSAWQAMSRMDAYQIHEIPRTTPARTGDARGDDQRDQRLAALVSAYHAGTGPILVSWVRPVAAGPVSLLIGGAGLSSGDRASDMTVVSLPAGARGLRLPPGALPAALEAMPYWAPIAAITDGLLADEQQQRPQPDPDAIRPSLEDCLLGVWHEPFAWLVFAEPVLGDDLDELIAQVATEQRGATARAGSSPGYAVTAQRLTHRHRDLSQAVSTGLWRTHFLAGGASREAAIRVAALLCASTDLRSLPYALAPGAKADQLDTFLHHDLDLRGGDSPFHATAALLAAIARPPAVEVPGVQFRLRPEFDVTPELTTGHDASETTALRLGTVLDRNRTGTGPMLLPRSSLNRHTFVCGATGAGKSQTVRGLLESATAHGLPWLVVEPAKAEYRLMATRLAGTDRNVVAIRPGEADALPAGINPLEPAIDADGRRYPLQTHADLVRALFLAAFDSDEPFPQVLSAALTRCYEQLGWDLALGEPHTAGVQPRYPTLADLQQAAEQVVDEIGYGKEITDNVRGFIRVRLSSLRLGTTGRFLEGGHPLDFDALLTNNVVFEIEDVGDDRDKAFLMGTVLIRLTEHLRLDQRRRGGPSTPLRHLSVFEEAHRLLRNHQAGAAAHAVEMFAGLLAEIRAYGEGLIIAEQIPAKILPDVIKNTAIKIVHRLPAQDDRDAVGATMNITDSQSDYVVTLQPGHAAIFTDGMDYPLLVAMPDGTSRETGPPVTPAGVTALVTPRSPTCGPDCHNTPCTLRQIRTAQRALDTDPRLVLWAELAVLAHLTGWTTPAPRQLFLDDLRAVDNRTLDCALAHAVDNAVASRGTVIARRVSPAALATHVTTALRTLLATGQRHIGQEPEWLAPAYRWCLVWDRLVHAHRESADAGRHPRSVEWEHTYGRPIPGDTNEAQLDIVQSWFDADQSRPSEVRAVAYGTRPMPAVAAAVGARPDAPDWTDRLTDCLSSFVKCRWPHRYLTATTRPGTGST